MQPHLHVFAGPRFLARIAPRMGYDSFIDTSSEQTEHQTVLRCLYRVGGIFADLPCPGNRSLNSFTTANHYIYAAYSQRGWVTFKNDCILTIGSDRELPRRSHLGQAGASLRQADNLRRGATLGYLPKRVRPERRVTMEGV